MNCSTTRWRFLAAAFLAALLTGGTVQARSDAWLKLEQIDVQPNGAPTAARYAIKNPTISDDGRWVIFDSPASDLVSGDSNGRSDIFVRDRLVNITRRIDLRPDGTQTTADSTSAAASSNGRFVTFISFDRQLAANDVNDYDDQFVLDRDSDGNGTFDEPGGTTLDLVSINSSNITFYNGVRKVVSAVNDGGTSVLYSTIYPVASGDNNSKADVYVRERTSASTRLLSQSSSGVIGNDDSPDFFRPPLRMSDSGAIVAFSSAASNLVAGDTNGAADLFVRDRDIDRNGVFDEPGGSSTVLAGTGPGGSGAPFLQFDLSGDGRWLAITAANPSGANPAGSDIYLHDLVSGSDSPIAFEPQTWKKGAGGCCGNQSPKLSRKAQVLVFTSHQSYTLDNVITGRNDVFAQSRGRALVRLTDYPLPSSLEDGYSAVVATLSRNGGYLLIGFAGAGAVASPEEGYFIYQRDEIFASDFE